MCIRDSLDTGKPGSRIALRADIDALLVPEEPNNLAGPRVVVSDDPHTSHACGHDAHTAMLLGAMRVLAEQRDNLTGVIYFCFEEGEEDGRGILDVYKRQNLPEPLFCDTRIKITSGDRGGKSISGKTSDITGV